MILKHLRKGRTGITMLVIGFANLGIGFVTMVILAKLMAPSEYGEYVFALGLANIAAMPIELGLPTLMMREIARYRAREDALRIMAMIAWVLALVTGGFMLVIAVYFLFFDMLSVSGKIRPGLQLWTLALLLPLSLMNWARGVLIGFEKPVLFAMPDSIFRPVLLLLFIGIAAYSDRLDPAMAMACHVAAVALCFVWSAVMAVRILRQNAVALKVSRQNMEVRSWLTALMPMTLVSGLRIINRRIDIVMLGTLGSTIAVAGYNIALQITSLILVAQTMLNNIIGPRIAFAYEQQDLVGLRRAIATATVVSTGFALAAVLGILVAGPWLLLVLFGDRYDAVYPLMAVLCIGQLASACLGPTALLLNMSRHEKRTLQTGIVAAVLNVSLNAILIPQYMAMGAAIAGSTTLIVIQLQRWWMVRRHIGVRSDVFAAYGHWRANGGA